MLPDLTVKPERCTMTPSQQAQAYHYAQALLEVIGQLPPVYGHIEVTFLAGKLTKLEKRESFKP